MLLLAVVGVVNAAQPVPAIPAIRFTVFSLETIADLSFVPGPGLAPQKVVLYPTARSKPHEYRGAMPVRFVDKAGKNIADATIPAGITEALILLLSADPAARGPTPLRAAVLDDGIARHGAGGLVVANLSGLSLSGVIGAHAVLLKPGLNPLLPVGHSTSVTLRTLFKDRTYQSYSDQVELFDNERALLLLFPPYYPGSLEVQGRLLIDKPPSPPASARAR